MDSGSGKVALHYSHEVDHSVEMPKDSHSGKVALHFSDLYSQEVDHSVEMQKDSGSCKVALHYPDLYSHKVDHSAEMQIDSCGGNICYTEEGDGFLDPAVEYTESTSKNEENSSREDCISDTLEKMSDSNEDQPEDLSVG